MKRYKIRARVLPDDRPITVVGRDAWALERLIEAGQSGFTSLENPAPRISHYVWKLRTKHGLAIQTIEESHGGTFAGHHARYILASDVEILKEGEEAA